MTESQFVVGIIDLILSDTSPVTPAQQSDVDAFDAAVERAQRQLEQQKREPPPAAYYVDQFNRTLPVSWELLRNGGDRISLARAMEDQSERDRLDAAMLIAYPLDE